MTEERVYTGAIPVLSDPRQGDGEARAQPAPLFLLADSQLLFWREGGGRFLDRVAAHTGPGAPRAAYLGASNGDQPEFYALFLAAMEAIGPAECRMIPGTPSDEDRAFLEAADVILLAGGDTDAGWRAFEASGIRQTVERRYWDGAVLVGVSAGSVQLGAAGWPAGDPHNPFGTWGLAPFVVDAHAEADEWAELRAVVRARGEGARGIGIPSGGGLVYHADGTLEAVRHTLAEFTLRGGELSGAVIFPPGEEEEREG